MSIFYDRNGNQFTGRVVKGIALPRNPRIETLRRLGLYRYTGREAVPEGRRATSWHLEYDDETMTCRQGPDALEPVPKDPAIAALVEQIRAIWQALGIDPVPADWESAMAALESYPDAAAATRAAVKLLALRQALVEAGGDWTDVLEEAG